MGRVRDAGPSVSRTALPAGSPFDSLSLVFERIVGLIVDTINGGD